MEQSQQKASYETCAFLLKGKAVQGVKLRRYIEAAGKWSGVGGYCINTDDGSVFGEAWVKDCDDASSSLDRFQTWIQGKHTPKIYTNIKPTPIGSAYPEKAQVDQYVTLRRRTSQMNNGDNSKMTTTFETFTMVRDDQEASIIALKRNDVYNSLLLNSKTNNDNTNVKVVVVDTDNNTTTGTTKVEIGSWPKKDKEEEMHANKKTMIDEEGKLKNVSYQ